MQRLRVPAPLAWAALLVGAWAAAFILILPIKTGQVGFDSAASVLYFDRIVAGRQLEWFLTATPKPLLTVVYGSLHALTGDWRPISWLAIGLFGVCVVLAAALARRLAGLAAAGFAGLAFMGSSVLLRDVALAYTVVWMAVACLVAGLALTRDRPAYLLAGLALLAAGTVRLESLVIVGVASAALVIRALATWRRPERWAPPPRAAWLLMLGWLALPIQAIHDLLLTGDPLWSQTVPVAGSIGAPIVGPLGAARQIVDHYAAFGPLVALAILGLILLWSQRRWTILLGLLALGPGILAFIMLLAVRGIYISYRYYTPADLALLFTAAIGIGAVRVPLVAAAARTRVGLRARPAALLAAGAVAGTLFVMPWGMLDRSLLNTVRSDLVFHLNADAARPTLLAAIAGDPTIRSGPHAADPHAGAVPVRDPAVLVPVLLRPQLAVDLDLPLDVIAGSDGSQMGTDGTYPVPGQIVYHDPRGDRPQDAFAFLEIDRPTTVGSIGIDPLAADPARRFWVLRITAPGEE